MKHIILCAALTVFGTSALADDSDTAPSLMERGAQLFMEGILKELEPAIEGLDGLTPQLRGFVEEMGPAMVKLLNQVKDWSAFHPPEVLPNGDIIIRRKTPKDAEDDGAIDL